MMNLCLVGDINDLNLVYVGWAAEKVGFNVLKLSEDELGLTWSFNFNDLNTRESTITYNDEEIKFSDIAGVYVRFNPEPKCHLENDLSREERDAFIVERRSALHNLLNYLDCMVVNPPAAGRSNGSKPLQMFQLAQAGFRVPEWIVTNTFPQYEIFRKKYPEGTVYKSCSGLRSHVRQVDSELIELLTTGTSPVIIQRYIKGKDVRVHTIGDSYFATEIVSEGIDYRFQDGKKEYKGISIPNDIFLMCKRFAESEKLIIAGFDFRVHDGEWYCLEVNPVPTFLPYEMETGQPIAESILKTMLLKKGVASDSLGNPQSHF